MANHSSSDAPHCGASLEEAAFGPDAKGRQHSSGGLRPSPVNAAAIEDRPSRWRSWRTALSAPQEQAAIKFGESGNATLYVLSGPSGQAHETVFPLIVAQVLGLRPEQIELRASDPLGPPLIGGGTVGSRSLMSHGAALYATAQEVVKKGLDFAAKELEVSKADLEFSAGKYRVKGTDLSVAFSEILKRYGGATTDPLKAQQAMSRLSAKERRAVLDMQEQQGIVPEGLSREQRRRLERAKRRSR